jgi:hypothetical protein
MNMQEWLTLGPITKCDKLFGVQSVLLAHISDLQNLWIPKSFTDLRSKEVYRLILQKLVGYFSKQP